ncbi:MAG: SMP-30/gluconolactonase/LRE family protein [Verrucomicrobia bacterium]|nr:SMP-30/gluconolactonase/LRE family protein [Verrucomicrobiota bacterium]
MTVLACLASAWASYAADFEMRDEAEFKKIVAPGAKLERLATDMRFTEGPVWLAADGGYLVFSDIPADELKKWSPKEGLSTFRKPSRNANGNTVDREGRLITCEHSGRRVSILEKDGTLRTLADQCDGKTFNSPNDAVVKSDGTIWFTDPPYGLPRDAVKEQDGNYVFRYDPKTQKGTRVAEGFDMPNGLCFSPDEKKLYVADSGKPRHLRVFDVQPDGTLKDAKVFCEIDRGVPDGIRCDAQGRIYSSAGDGVHIFAPDGKLIGKILVPESAANLCFGGADGKTLFITARTSLYSIPLRIEAAK